jgi:hypothetical protein
MEHHATASAERSGPYRGLVIMAALSFIAMFGLMYAMVASADAIFMNLNQAYMAGLMAAPMVLIELAVMRKMYPRTRLNLGIGVGAFAAMLLFFLLIRRQAVIGNEQFLRSMIPHHSGAILMCNRAAISDPAIRSLCQEIVRSQQEEIVQMKTLLGTP